MSTSIPTHPQPGFYETTVAPVRSGGKVVDRVDHTEFERIANRPRWSIEMAKAVVDGTRSAEKRLAKRRSRST